MPDPKKGGDMITQDVLELEGTFPIRYIPEDFFECDHGYGHYSECPLCSQYPTDLVKEIDDYFGDEVSVEDKAVIAKWLSRDGDHA